jgi:cardiolipin synthase
MLNSSKESGVYIATAILALSYITDILDGYIARRKNMVTELGKILDPLADKVTQLAVVIVLLLKGYIPAFVVIILLVKELIQISGGIYIKIKLKAQMPPANIFGKISTGMFYISMLLLLLSVPYAIYIVYSTIIMLVIAFINYVIMFIKFRKETCNNNIL